MHHNATYIRDLRIDNYFQVVSLGGFPSPEAIFTVRPGVDAVDALVHASTLARAIQEIADDYAQHHAPEAGRAMIWSILHSAETVRALLEGLLDAMEA